MIRLLELSILYLIGLLSLVIHKSFAQTIDRKYEPVEYYYYTPQRSLPAIPFKRSNDTLGIQLGAGINVTELFQKSFSAVDLIYTNFDFIYQKDDILFKQFFLSTYNSVDSIETAAFFQGLGYKRIGLGWGIESELRKSINQANFLIGPAFANHYLSIGCFYKSDETIEASSRFIHHWGSAQLSVVGSFNFYTNNSFLLLSIVRVFKL